MTSIIPTNVTISRTKFKCKGTLGLSEKGKPDARLDIHRQKSDGKEKKICPHYFCLFDQREASQSHNQPHVGSALNLFLQLALC